MTEIFPILTNHKASHSWKLEQPNQDKHRKFRLTYSIVKPLKSRDK
jgi:hypothetical protein